MNYSQILAKEFSLREDHCNNIINLINEGNTIPFIARYRKEATGSCDDQVLRAISDRLTYLVNLNKRKDEVKASITEQGKWSDELEKALDKAIKLTEVEDIYRPYKQKRKTRASVAIAKGLEPLADIIFAQSVKSGSVKDLTAAYINEEKGVNTSDEAIEGAKDIIAERVSDDAELRKSLRTLIMSEGVVTTKLQVNDKSKTYEMYSDYSEKLSTMPSHRILAINRGEKEDCLKVSIDVAAEVAIHKINRKYLKEGSITTKYVEEAIEDSYKRLVFPSLEREARNELTERAFEQAIKMFELNLKPLLLQPPLKGKTILAVDPAYRTGCKVAIVDSNSNLLATDVIYPTPPQSRIEEAEFKIMAHIVKHNVNVICIGNGTATKEAEIFVSNLIKKTKRPLQYTIVNEAGASVYSASKLGAEEFPELDVSLRSAISIARRLQDPLAELIKIDVKSIGVGQYQHDMPEKRLTEVLGGVVEDCVNSVGVDLNTASVSLLTYVAGLNNTVAKNIIEYRKSKKFKTRKELTSIPKLGAKAYEQCAGFLRIAEGDNVLDNTAVHPEAYASVEKLLKHYKYTLDDVKAGKFANISSQIEAEGYDKVAGIIGVGVPTLKDIVAELLKPGRDIRENLPPAVLRSDLLDIKDLKAGMEIEGTVRNVIDFGAFIDIGVHQDGLVHLSEICDRFIKHPSEILTVGDRVKVKVLSVDMDKNRIALTMKTQDANRAEKPIERADRKDKSNNKDNKLKTELKKKQPEDLNSMLNMLKNKFQSH